VLRFQRPTRAKGFAKEVSSAVRATRKAISAGERPEFPPEHWSKHKAVFSAAQRGKCGYCETFALNHPAAVDHFAPKGAVHVLVSEGIELDDLSNVSDRATLEISATGYHWLAYDWNNWLLVCERCNTRWKGALFPVQEAPHPCPPQPLQKYTALLLNPYGPEDPEDHLDFNGLGQIFPRGGSAAGEATIRTCGLHRESLRRMREGPAADTDRHLRRLEQAMFDGDLTTAQRAAEDLLALGSDTRAHAGMVRSLVRSRLHVSYGDLVKLARRLAEVQTGA
jgi:hypothetical protein